MDKKREGLQESLTVRLSPAYLAGMDRLVREGIYASRGEIIRDGLRKVFLENGIKIVD